MKRTLSLISILFLAFIWPAYAYSVENSFPEAEKPSPLEASHSGPVAGMQESFREVFNLYKDSVVFISTEKEVEVRHPFQNDPFFKRFFDGSPAPGKQQQKGLGTGFVLSSDGYICTNHHVVANMDSVKVVLDGKEYDAKILGSDELTDIALLKIDGARGLKPVHLGDSDNVQVGDWAIAIGNPFGLDRTFTVGVISSVSRSEVDHLGNAHIQTDASINPGNSGGPLINLNGEVIGVHRMIYSQNGGNMGIGFAIPINTARAVLSQLKSKGKVEHGYLGVSIRPAAPTEKGPEYGVYVESLDPQGPGKKAGIQPGDWIVRLNGDPIKNFGDLLSRVAAAGPGETVELGLWRDGKTIQTKATLIQRPAPE